MINYLSFFVLAFILGIGIGVILFDTLVTRPMMLQVVREHKQQLDLEQAKFNELKQEANDIIASLKQKNNV